MTAYVIPNAILITTPRAKYTFASLLARDTAFDVIFNVWRLARPEDSAILLSAGSGSGAGSLRRRMAMEEVRMGPVPGVLGLDGVDAGVGVPKAAETVLMRMATQCACGRAGQHLSETALETVLPGTPDRIHNLMFASGFMKDFMKDDQKLLGAYPLSVW
jgi:hypothetical protein